MDELKAGRELDALIAEKIFGIKELRVIDYYDKNAGVRVTSFPDLPSYSTDIAAAWEVVEKLFLSSWWIKIEASETNGADVTFTCQATARGRFHEEGGTVPHAICLAALKAL